LLHSAGFAFHLLFNVASDLSKIAARCCLRTLKPVPSAAQMMKQDGLRKRIAPQPDLPDDEFDYEKYAKQEFRQQGSGPAWNFLSFGGSSEFWIVAALLYLWFK